jgi:hypothetical protein
MPAAAAAAAAPIIDLVGEDEEKTYLTLGHQIWRVLDCCG